MRAPLAVAILLASSAPAWAALGEPAESVRADHERFGGGALRTRTTSRFTVHEMGGDGGPVVREMVGPDGFVFAVAWDGPRMPDLSVVLGRYHADVQDAVRAGGRRRQPVLIKRADLVVESGGRPRAFRGRAWLPERMPEGVTAEDVR